MIQPELFTDQPGEPEARADWWARQEAARLAAIAEKRRAVELDPRPMVLVGCSKQKRKGTWPAAELYTSPLFLKARAWAERFGYRWAVLSAHYAVIEPTKEVASYDVTIRDRNAYGHKLKPHEYDSWLQGHVQAWYCFDWPRPLVVLAGEAYTRPLRGFFEHLQEPLVGMQIGERLRWLTQQLNQPHNPEAKHR